MGRIHPTAVIDPRAKLADDVEVGPYAVIGEGVELASNVEIASHVHIEGRTVVGTGTVRSLFTLVAWYACWFQTARAEVHGVAA